MLGKLLKYEFKSTARALIPLYIIAVLFSLLSRGFNELSKNLDVLQTPTVLLYMLCVILIIAVVVITLVMILQRFYKNLLGDEGYLMFTLPVESHTHIITKLITAFVWTVASVIIALATVFILAYNPDLWETITSALSEIPEAIWTLIRQFGLIMIFQSIASIMMIYAAISIGQLVTGHKVIGSLVSYFGLYIVNQIIMTVVMVIIGYLHRDVFDLFNSETVLVESGIATQFTISIGVINLALCIAYFFVINYIFKRKLNLE